MHQIGGLATIFAPYFLVPLAFAAGVLLLEIGMVARSPLVQRLALLTPLAALALSSIECAKEGTALEFLADFRAILGGTPLYFTLILTAGFYVWAALRRVSDAIDALTATLFALVLVSPQTYGVDTLGHPRALPVLFAAVAQGIAAARHPGSQRCFLAACCLIAAATIAWQDTWFTAWEGFLPRHLALGMLLVISAAFKDRLARFLEYFAAIALAGYGSSAALGTSLGIGPVPAAMATAYPGLVIAAALVLGWLLRNRLYLPWRRSRPLAGLSAGEAASTSVFAVRSPDYAILLPLSQRSPWP